jgi:ABC-type bacteriocin/lantibiotic exporter with double-glycine peptidase domain
MIDGVPFIRQDTNFCGPAALASVMSYYGESIDQQTIGEETYNAKLKGCLISDLENFARARRFETMVDRGTVDQIKDFLHREKPVIVLVDLGRWFISRPHYLVIIGYTEEGFIAHSGYKASQLFGYEKFTKLWEKIGNTYLVVYR